MPVHTFHRRYRRQMPVLTALDRVRAAAPGPISPDAHRALSASIDADARLIEFDLRCQFARELEEARLQCAGLDEQQADAQHRLLAAAAALAQARAAASSLLRSALYTAAALSTAVCEYLVSWATLPAALDIEQASVMGVAISLAPVIAFIGIKEPIEHFVEHAPRWAVRVLFAVVTGAVLYLGYTMVMARAEVMRVLVALMAGDLTVAVRERPVDQFILALSLVLIVLGAMFLANAFRHGRPWLVRATAAWHLRRCRRQQLRLRQQLEECRSRELALRAEASEKPVLVGDSWRRQAYAELAGVAVAYPAVDEAVERSLGLRPRRSVFA